MFSSSHKSSANKTHVRAGAKEVEVRRRHGEQPTHDNHQPAGDDEGRPSMAVATAARLDRRSNFGGQVYIFLRLIAESFCDFFLLQVAPEQVVQTVPLCGDLT